MWTAEIRSTGVPWTNLSFAVKSGTAKRGTVAYRLGWNGQRVSRSADLTRLVDRFPGVAEEVVAWLESRPLL